MDTRTHHFATSSRPSRAPVPGTLAAAFAAGKGRIVVSFAGQGAPCLDELAALFTASPTVRRLVQIADRVITEESAHAAIRWSGLFAEPMRLTTWITTPESRPTREALTQSHTSHPIVFLTQIGRWASLLEQGLDRAVDAGAVIGCVGHSQGLLGALTIAEAGGKLPSDDAFAQRVATVFWQGFWSQGGKPEGVGDGPFMASIAGPRASRLDALIAAFNKRQPEHDRVWLAVRNTPTRAVVSGLPATLAAFRARLDAVATAEDADRKARRRGGAPLSFQWEIVPVGAPFHVPLQQAARDRMASTCAERGFAYGPLALPVWDSLAGGELARNLGGRALTDVVLDRQFLDPVDWTATLRALVDSDRPTHVIDVGPDVGVARLSSSTLRGLGVMVIAAAETAGQEALFTVGAALPATADWSVYAPRAVSLMGQLAVETRYTRLTGHAPLILGGMTPTTVDVGIVAAAANAGFSAELAGGGQVTPEIFAARMAELSSALEPGVEVVFNALLLDPWLFDLHLGAQALVAKARRAGRPLRGVTMSGGVPEVARGVALLDGLNAAGLWQNAFKPGTVAQVRAVAEIAANTPHLVFVHLECGTAGGHHGWDDLDEVLLATYGRLRELPNVVLCAGGGVGDPGRAADLLSGRWALAHGEALMPVDAVILGTVAMACAEATASAAVKAALAAAPGHAGFVGANAVAGGVTSGRSGLDADIHYLENAASACGRLLDEVAGDAAAVLARRAEIIDALNRTAKPYFGDLDAMTYAAVLERMVEQMAIGDRSVYTDGVWLDRSWRQRVFDFVRRAESRCAEAEDSVVAGLSDLDAPQEALARLFAAVPALQTTRLHPADVDWFVGAVCARPGKPVPFVPVIDADVRRWYKADSLWQAQHDKFSADQVLVIPGPAAVGGITTVNEPVADLMRRFEAGIVTTLGAPVARAHRRVVEPRGPVPHVDVHRQEGRVRVVARAGASTTALLDVASAGAGLLAALVAADQVTIGDRRVDNPVRRLLGAVPGAVLQLADEADGPVGEAREARFVDPSGDKVALTAVGDRVFVVLTLPSGATAELTVTAIHRPEQLVFVIDPAAYEAALRALFTAQVAGKLIPPVPWFEAQTAQSTLSADRARAYAALTGALTPDAVFAACWEPIFQALLIEGAGRAMLGLVHLTHEVNVAADLSLLRAPCHAEAQLVAVEDAPGGRSLEVLATLWSGALRVGTLRERFFVRGADAGVGRAVMRPIDAVTRPLDAADVAFVRGVDGLDWSVEPAIGDVVTFVGQSTVSAGERFVATGALAVGGAQVGSFHLDATHPPGEVKTAPIDALLAVLAPASGEQDRPRKTLGERTVKAPSELLTYAEVGGDRNPIHTSPAVARLAGLDGVIVHGMWTSARMAAVAAELAAEADPGRLRAWTTSFVGVVRPGEALQIRVERTGVVGGACRVEVTARALRGEQAEVVAVARGTVAAPRTAVVFPGQGIQRQGMGQEGYGRSKAARATWDRADQFTRAKLGFSVLRLVRENPAELRAGDAVFRHPEGVLHLTRFTQVAMSVTAAAQVAELREAGVMPEDPVFCGHSIGEYNAIGALGQLLPLETLIEVVYHRGATMETRVPRDASGQSGYAMIAVRPEAVRLDEAGLRALVAGVAAASGGFLEIVNLNVRDVQYAITGDLAAVATLESTIASRVPAGGKPASVRIPGIDVPFHSSRLADGVPAFRGVLEQVVPATLPWRTMVGRYVPNLVAAAFELSPAFVARVIETTRSTVLQAVLDASLETVPPDVLARMLIIELLAWQFASPVRWIETQELLFRPVAQGGLGVGRLIEVGVGQSPTVRNMAGQTLARWAGPRPAVALLHVEVDAAAVFQTEGDAPAVVEEAPVAEVAPVTTVAAPVVVAAGGASAAVAPADRRMSVAEGLRALVALQARLRLDQLRDDDTLDGLVDGVSARRNQILLDLGAELAVSAMDGAHERGLAQLATELAARAGGYRGPGPYLQTASQEAVRRLLGPAGLGAREAGQWLQTSYGLGEGLTAAALVHLALIGREGNAGRGGALGAVGPASSVAEAHAALEAAVASLSAATGVALNKLGGGAAGGTAVDSAALDALRAELLGADGVLAAPLRALAERLGLGLGAPLQALAGMSADTARLAALDAELGAAMAEAVRPRFDARRHLRMDDITELARRDLLALVWDLANARCDAAAAVAELDRLAPFAADPVFAANARYLAGQVADPALSDRMRTLTPAATPPFDDPSAMAVFAETWRASGGALADRLTAGQALDLRGRTALVTGASPGSIALEAVRHLLRGGARVVVTTSDLSRARAEAYREVYRRSAGPGAELHVVPFNQASRRDVTALIDWLFERRTERDGANVRELKPAFAVDLVLPFAAAPSVGTLDTLGPAEEVGLRTLLLGVEWLIGGIAARYVADGVPNTPCHVILPLSPNHGTFGGDGLYGEAKAALDALVNRWSSERAAWGRAVTLCAATIGWVRGTGLMGGNDVVADAVEAEAGARTFSAAEMGWLIAAACTARAEAASAPLRLDLAGGLSAATDLVGVVGRARARLTGEDKVRRGVTALRERWSQAIGLRVQSTRLRRLPRPPVASVQAPVAWPAKPSVDLSRMVVIVGFGELGPWGSSRTRHEVEVCGGLAPAAVAELAWMCGLVRYDAQRGGGAWIDVESGDEVAEDALVARYEAQVRSRSGVRFLSPTTAGADPEAVPVLETVRLDEDLRFEVASDDEARSFQLADPARTTVGRDAEGRVWVTRKSGAMIRVPRAVRLTRRVCGAVPDGFDPARYGVPAEMIASVDRLTLMNLVTTVEAFASAGMTPEELLRHVHPTRVANTQGSGIGGMTSIRRLYQDLLLGEQRQGDMLQETLGNVVAAWVVQSFVGSYGSMSHPVAACATAAVSVEIGVEKILAGKADFVVTGGFDDVGMESVTGFSDMHATADTDELLAMGLDPDQMSRGNDVRRRGFIEAQGGGTVLLARGDVAARLGLPVRGVVAYAGSFADGVHTSIPAPGLGVVGAVVGGRQSPLGEALAGLGLGADDVAVVFKHDTSTGANDPNEAEIHQVIQTALGRSAGNPLLVASQKALTGHAKGGAAAWQLIGLAQALESGVVPGNKNLSCLDPVMKKAPFLLHSDRALHAGAVPLRAGLLTSLGFGHVSALVLVVHAGAFVAALDDEARAAWAAASQARLAAAARGQAEVMLGRRPAFTKRTARRLDGLSELAMLQDPGARLGAGGAYVAGL